MRLEAFSIGWVRYRFELYADARGAWRWRLVAANGRVLAESGEGYRRRADAYQGLQRVRLASQSDLTEVVHA
jgi:uncharacterized protein YegP (UPF0339 family)